MRTVDVPIGLIFPKVVQTDPDKMGAYLKILSELGVMSKETIMREVGLDPDIEMARIENEDQHAWDKNQERIATQSADFGSDKGDPDVGGNPPSPELQKKTPPEDDAK